MRTLTSWDSLQPLIGTTSESGDLDFKATLDPSTDKKIEFAKDVAALREWGHSWEEWGHS